MAISKSALRSDLMLREQELKQTFLNLKLEKKKFPLIITLTLSVKNHAREVGLLHDLVKETKHDIISLDVWDNAFEVHCI